MWRSSLFGRADEAESLLRILRRAEDGNLGLAFIQGEAGIGKSRLLEETLEKARTRGFSVLYGACDELERARSFGPLADALGCRVDSEDPARREIAAALLDHPGLIDAGNVHYRIVESFGALIESEAVRGRVALAIEDLHWADLSTLYTLHSFRKRLTDLPVAIAATLRALPRSSELERLIRRASDQNALVLELGPLDSSAVFELAGEVLGARPGDELQRALASAGGNPFFLHELLDALVREGAIVKSEGTADARFAVLPPDLRKALLQRIAHISDDALDLLRVAAILGATFSPDDLATVAGRPMNQLLSAIGEWQQAGLIVEEHRSLRFRHDLIRDVLYEDTPEGIRVALHREVAQALSKVGAPAQQIAEHYARGAAPGDAEAVRAIREASRNHSLSPAARVELLRRAVELLADPGPDRDATVTELADALVWGGAPMEGEQMARDVLGWNPPPQLASEARLVVVRALWLDARWIELAEQAGEFLKGYAIGEEERGLLLAYRALGLVLSNHPPEEAGAEAEEALAIGERLDSRVIMVLALIALQFSRNFAGRSPEELPLAERAVEIVERGRDPSLDRLHPHVILGGALHVFGRWEEAEEIFRRGVQLREHSGTVWDLPYYLATSAMVHERFGKWDEAVAEAEAAISSADEIGTQVGLTTAHLIAGKIAVPRGELDSAEEHLLAAQEMVRTRGTQWGNPLGLAIGLHEARGEKEKALELVKSVVLKASPQEQAQLLLDSVPIALMAGDRQLATELVEGAASASLSGGNPPVKAFITAGRGLLEDRPEVLILARDAFRELRLWRSALVAEHAGSSLARLGRLEEARALFREALESYGRMGAHRLTARTLATMRSFGMKAGKRGSRRRPKTGWDSLTDTERRVAELAAKGLTNPQIAERLFISRHTVVSHLRHVFAKLGISSRMKLVSGLTQTDPESQS